ncbi:MAG: hypothetical protein ABH879_08185 [archaeon]
MAGAVVFDMGGVLPLNDMKEVYRCLAREIGAVPDDLPGLIREERRGSMDNGRQIPGLK